jgi:Tol biopolymer transport system component
MQVGTRLGAYEVIARLGEGGMGEVYRARDTRLDRTVAIKVIAPHRVADPSTRERFQREARAVAALNHPHICHLNDVGHHDGVDFLVMEFLDGETLAARLARGRLSLDEVLRHAIEIADALAEAHAHAIVHRDLKPANVMLTKTGVKLLDFGLAKMGPASSGPVASLSTLGPTRAAPLTDEGSVLGTWPYMAPEQLEGKEADARTDIFAFGAVLYEMATGARAFEGESHASVIAAILTQHPPAFATREVAAPPALERVVRKCLAKSVDVRWQSARDLADALQWIAEEHHSSTQRAGEAPASGRGRSRRWPWVAGLGAAAALGLAAVWNLPRVALPAAPVRRFVIQPVDDARLMLPQPRFSLSPDGRSLVYTAESSRGVSLYLRLLDQLVERKIPGTEGVGELAFSPDGQWVAFSGNGVLKKVSLTSGAPPLTLVERPGPLDQSLVWLPDNTIVVGRIHDAQSGGGLFRVSADGGAFVKLTTPDPAQNELDHHFPRMLPGGKALLVSRHLDTTPETFAVAVVQLDTGTVRTILPNAFDALYVPTGHLVFARGGALLAAPFDLNRLELSGPPVVMVDRVLSDNNAGGSASFGWGARYAIADDGTLAYIPPAVRNGRRLVWVNGTGTSEPLPFEPRAFARPSLSADGQRVAVQIEEDGQHNIWLYDLRQGTFRPLTSDGASQAPTWTRDGQRVTFSATKDGREELFWQPIDGRPAERLLADAWRLFPGSWSPDGRTLAFLRHPPSDLTEFGLFDVEARRSTKLLAGQTNVTHPQISPDGRWLAYTVQSSRPQVHVAALGETLIRRQITTGAGHSPVWSRDGKLLYYRGVAGQTGTGGFFAVDVSGLPTTIGKPTTVVEPGLSAGRGGAHHAGYDVAPDGRLLIVQQAPEESAPLRFEIVLNWFEELKQRVPLVK